MVPTIYSSFNLFSFSISLAILLTKALKIFNSESVDTKGIIISTKAAFTLEELQKSGQTVGPRLFSTGFILYGAEGDFKAVVNNLDDARFAIERTKAFGAKSVKSYNQPRR